MIFFKTLSVYIIKKGKGEVVIVKAFGVIYRVCFVCDLKKSVRCIVLSYKRKMCISQIYLDSSTGSALTSSDFSVSIYKKMPCQYYIHSRVNDPISLNIPTTYPLVNQKSTK